MGFIACTGCRKDVSGDTETCPDCGYPVLSGTMPGVAVRTSSEERARRAAISEYNWIQLLGVVVFCAGIAAAIAESIAATAAITIGVITFIVGLVGRWWNRD